MSGSDGGSAGDDGRVRDPEHLGAAAFTFVAVERAVRATLAAVHPHTGEWELESALSASRRARAAYANVLRERGGPVPDGLLLDEDVSPADLLARARRRWAGEIQQEHLRWDSPPPTQALCLTAVRDMSASEVLQRIGADRKSPVVCFDSTNTYDDWLAALPAGANGVFAFTQGAWTWVVESNGYLGADALLARTLSAHGGAFVSVWWNVNAYSRFLYAEGGQVLRDFPIVCADEGVEYFLGDPLPEEDDLEWETLDWSAALTLQARLTGQVHGNPEFRGSELAAVGFSWQN